MRNTLRLVVPGAVVMLLSLFSGCRPEVVDPAPQEPDPRVPTVPTVPTVPADSTEPSEPTDTVPAVWGALGDSQTDEYQADDNRGPPTAINWLEILAQEKHVDFGAWSDRSRGEPRRAGYEYNWARSSAVMSGVVSAQLDGLVAQIAGASVTHAVLFATGNEWVNRSPYLMNAIYNSPDGGVTDATGTAIAARVAVVAGQINHVMERLAQAVIERSTGGGIVILTPPDYALHPGVILALTNPVRRGYVSDAIQAIHESVSARAETINSTAGRTLVSVLRSDNHLVEVWASADGRYVTAAGVRLDYRNDSPDGSPYFVALASSGTGSAHMGTIGGGMFARAFIEAANGLEGIAIKQLTDAEIRAAAGIDSSVE
jgi:hypothetical protein